MAESFTDAILGGHRRRLIAELISGGILHNYASKTARARRILPTDETITVKIPTIQETPPPEPLHENKLYTLSFKDAILRAD